MLSFTEIYNRLPEQLHQLTSAPSYPIKDLTEGAIKRLFGEDSLPIEGVFLIENYKENTYVYVGRSRNLAQRIGVDLRATTRQQATLSYKLTTLKEHFPNLQTIQEAREYMYDHYSVRMIKIEDENERAIFQIYAAMELGTTREFNNFRET